MLYLYQRITPNLNGKFYYFTSTANYLSQLSSNLSKVIQLDNYRINNNIAKVKIDDNFNEGDADTITYLIDIRDNNYFRCYHVIRSFEQSGYAVFNLSIDLWASYIYKASITNMRVSRTNKDIGTGIYDNIILTDAYTYENIGDATINNEDVLLVFTLNYNSDTSWYGTNSNMKMFAIDLKTIKDALSATQIPTYYPAEFYNAGVLASIFISGIKKAGINDTNYQDARVLNAYLIPKANILTGDFTEMYVESQSIFTSGTSVKLKCLDVVPYENIKNVTLTIDPAYKYYVGTKFDGLEVVRTTQSTINVKYKFITSQSDLKVIVAQGDNAKEITNSFKVPILQQETAQAVNGLTNVVGTGLGAIASIIGIATANPIGMATGAIGLTSQIATKSIEQSHKNTGQITQLGDAILTYYTLANLATTPLQNPFYIVKFASLQDENTIARRQGANFDVYVDTITTLIASNFLGSGSFNSIYLKCSNVFIDGIPAEANDFIKSQFTNGFYFISI